MQLKTILGLHASNTSLVIFVLGHQTLQRRKGEDVRGIISASTKPDQAQSRVQPHAQRGQGRLPQRLLRRR